MLEFTAICSPQVATESDQAEQENALLLPKRETPQNMFYIFIDIIKSIIVQKQDQ